MRHYTLCCLLLLFPLGNQAIDNNEDFHKYHISRCLVNYDEASKTLQISQFLFLDDLEMALREQGADNLFLCTDKEVEKAEIYLERYINQHLHIEINQQQKDLFFIGKEASEDLLGVWAYFEIVGLDSVKELHIENDILMETYDDQKNVINIKGGQNKETYFLFKKGDAEGKVQW